jgi:hypothetical protein
MSDSLTGGCQCDRVPYQCFAEPLFTADYMNPQLPKFPKQP